MRLEAGKLTIIGTSSVDVNASVVHLNAAFIETHSTLKAETIIANSVVAHSYTPGAGNIW